MKIQVWKRCWTTQDLRARITTLKYGVNARIIYAKNRIVNDDKQTQSIRIFSFEEGGCDTG